MNYLSFGVAISGWLIVVITASRNATWLWDKIGRFFGLAMENGHRNSGFTH